MKNSSFAQINKNQIRGVIVNYADGTLLQGTSLRLTLIGGNAVYKNSSDKGEFIFSEIVPGKYELYIRNTGFAPVSDTILVKDGQLNDKTYRYELKPLSHNLDTVRISSKKDKKFITFSKGKISLDVASSVLAVGGNAYDVLLRAPGVSEQNENLSFRTKTVNVLINGRPSNLSGPDLKNYLSGMPSNIVEKVEIIPNPSSKYDSQGGSVIDIILKKTENYGLSGSFTASAGAGRYFRNEDGINLTYGTKRLGISGSYDLTKNKQYYKNSSSTIIQNDFEIVQNEFEYRNRTNQTYRVGVDYEISSAIKAGAQFRGFNNSGDRAVQNLSQTFVSGAENNIASTHTNSDVHISNPYLNTYLTLNVDSFGKKLDLNFDLFQQNRSWNDNIGVDNRQNLPVSADSLTNLRGIQPTFISTKVVSIDYLHPLLTGKLEMGFKAQLTSSKNNPVWEKELNNTWQVDPGRTYRFLYKENIYAAYLNWNTIFWNKLTANFGLRTEKMDLDANLLSDHVQNKRSLNYLFPSIGLEYELSGQSVLNANYRKNIDRFGFNIINPFKNYVSPYFSSVGNPNILPQINHDMEVTYTYKQAFVFGISYTKELDVIAPVNLPGSTNEVVSTFENLPSSELFYVFGNIPYRFFSWWGMNLSGGYGYYKYNITDDNTSRNKTWSYLAQLETYFSLKNDWKIELSAFSRGSYATGIYRVKAMSMLSPGIKKGFADNKFIVSMAVSDLFNSNVNTQTMDYQNIVMDSKNKVESRFVTFGITYNFGSKKKKTVILDDQRIKNLNSRI